MKETKQNELKQNKGGNLTIKKECISDYKKISKIGQGAYSKVILAQNIKTSKLVALKIINKLFIKKEEKQHQVHIEREVLANLKHNGVIQLLSAFQNEYHIYFSLEYASEGDLGTYIEDFGNLNSNQIRFVSAQILSILQYIHQKGIVHRDVKPQNILLDKNFHCKLSDFATAMIYDKKKLGEQTAKRILDIRNKFDKEDWHLEQGDDRNCRKSSFVGTIEYVCPELLEKNICSPQADLWALGCMIYKFFTGHSPFQAESEFGMFERIQIGDFILPKCVPEDAQKLLTILLSKNPSNRSGVKYQDEINYSNLMKHEFFKGIDFANLWTTISPLKKEGQKQVFKLYNQPCSIDQKHSSPSMISESTNLSPLARALSLKSNTIRGLVEYDTGCIIIKQSIIFSTYSPHILKILFCNGIRTLALFNCITKHQHIIRLSNQTSKCFGQDKGRFILIDKNNRKYKFKERDHPSTFWITEINNLISSQQ